jgi:phosphate transport system substrate-binding protein
MIARAVLALGLSLLFSWGMALVALAAGAGNLIIAGNGPELTTIEPLARAFEKANPRAYLDVVWVGNSKPVEMAKAGQAHIAVAGTEAPDLSATPIAWDGIGVLVHLSNFHQRSYDATSGRHFLR